MHLKKCFDGPTRILNVSYNISLFFVSARKLYVVYNNIIITSAGKFKDRCQLLLRDVTDLNLDGATEETFLLNLINIDQV